MESWINLIISAFATYGLVMCALTFTTKRVLHIE